ncbi:MAG: TetR/AcrR family transcriptional regulator [Paenibacillus sp.]|nr:TetR/AcrR family transcriptional regulator [Paenibacillus sp.]
MDNLTCKSDKLLAAAVELMAEKGFKGVTTKEIACAAGVSEMTLFRHFGTKQVILEQVIDRFHYSKPMQELFAEELTWELRADLTLISRKYQLHMNRNKKVIQIMFKESHSVPEVNRNSTKHPRLLKELLIQYFNRMQELGKISLCSSESQAMIFMWMNYGAFISWLFSDEAVTSITEEEFIKDSVEIFVRGLTPQSEGGENNGAAGK